jgi:hypothetical protein
MVWVAGNFEDPVRIAHGQPGIVQLNDQANHLSARGQSPIFNSWYLEGLEIVNPNHTSNAGTFSDLPTQYGGGINMFSAQILGSTNVYAGVNPMSVGNVGGAAIDMHLHESEKPEWRAKAGLIGFELGGGAALGGKSILDFNLRYSFTGLLTNLGADFGGEKIGFYDGVLSFRNTGPKHQFKLFAWAGRSENEFKRVEAPEDREKYKDFFNIDYGNDILGAGARYDVTLSPSLFLRSGIAYSSDQYSYSRNGQFGANPESSSIDNDVSILSSFAELTISHSQLVHTKAGIDYTSRTYGNEEILFDPFTEESLVRSYLNTAVTISPRLQFEVSGEVQHSFKFEKWIPGYRSTLTWMVSEKNDLFAGVRHSAGEPLYYTSSNNADVHLISDTYELGWIMRSKNQNIGINLFYQQMNRLLEIHDHQAFLYMADYPYAFVLLFPQDISNDGISRHTGAEGKWDYNHDNGWRFSFNQSFYKSERGIKNSLLEPGRYNGRYVTHILVGKEVLKKADGKNRFWNFTLRGMLHGGLWEPKIDEAQSAQYGTTIFQYPGLYDERLSAYKRIDLGIVRTIAYPKVRWRYSLDIQNLFGLTNIAYNYYDPFLQRVVAQKQLSIIPVLSVQASW